MKDSARSSLRPHKPIRFLLVLGSFAVAGCGSSSSPPGQTVRHVRLVGQNGSALTPGYDISTGNVVQDGQQDPNADFYLSLKMIISLYPPTLPAGQGGFCSMPGTFSSVADIPQDDLPACTWSLADLGGNAPHSQSANAGRAFLVKDRTDAFVAKLLVTGDAADDTGRAEVMFDIVAPRL